MLELLSEWAKVVNNPASLVAFSLLLVFLAFITRSGEHRWLAPVFVTLAAITLIGGLTVLFLPKSADKSVTNEFVTPPAQISVEKIDVITHGPGASATAFDFSNKNIRNSPDKSNLPEKDEKPLDTDK